MDSSVSSPTPGIRINLKTFFIITAISVGYLLLSALLVGFKTDQLFLAGLFNVLFYTSRATRRFILGFSIFIIFWIIFDFMKAFPNYWFGTVHIESLYRAEQHLFGIRQADGTIFTPNEFWRGHSHQVLDIAAGCFYLCWIPMPLAFAGYLFFTDRESFFKFALTFLLVNFIGFAIYYIYPAAPPWYVQLYGFEFQPHTPGNTAGLGRFDQLLHVSVFSSLYAKSSNVFAAMPSLHASYPLLVFYYAVKLRTGWFKYLAGLVMVGIWFAAVYSSHHYVLDVMAGICCGITGIALFNYLFNRKKRFYSFVQGCVAKTA